MMAQSSENLTTYNYSRFAEGEILYTNASVQAKFDAVKATEGRVNLVNQSGWWSSKLTDKRTARH